MVLGSSEVTYIDYVGNGNGRFDVGDMRAWLIQRGTLSAASPGSYLTARFERTDGNELVDSASDGDASVERRN